MNSSQIYNFSLAMITRNLQLSFFIYLIMGDEQLAVSN